MVIFYILLLFFTFFVTSIGFKGLTTDLFSFLMMIRASFFEVQQCCGFFICASTFLSSMLARRQGEYMQGNGCFVLSLKMLILLVLVCIQY